MISTITEIPPGSIVNSMIFIQNEVAIGYSYDWVQVDKQGFEPRSATLKAAVLPLNHSPIEC